MKKKIFICAIVIFTALMTVSMTANGMTTETYGITDNSTVIEITMAMTEQELDDVEQSIVTEETEPTAISVTESPTEEVTQSMVSEEELATESWVKQNRVIPDVVPEFVQETMKVYSAEKAQEKYPYDFTFLPKYRDIYYREPWFLYGLVDPDEWNNWCIEVILPHTENNTEPQEMYTVSFVKYFKISKEDFIAAAEKRKNEIEMKHELYGHEIGTEGQEIHNADIIYTFDNEIINNYYLRDQSTINQTH